MMINAMWLKFVVPAMLLALVASWIVNATFRRYARVGARSGLTGAQAAAQLLEAQGVRGVRIERVGGFMTDHYDPSARTLRLSPGVYDSPSLAAIGVACHEAGHALQHAAHYGPLALRSSLVPVTNIGSHLAIPIIFAGLLLRMTGLFNLGLLLFGLAVFFTLVTLPVEWNASARAKRLMVSSGIVTAQEQSSAASVLNAAFLTYLAAAVSAVMTLLYYVSIGRRNS